MRRGSRASPSKSLPVNLQGTALPSLTPRACRYSVRVAGVGLKKMLLDAEQKKVIIFYAVATCALVAWLCNMKAMSTWCKQPTTRHRR